MNQVVLALFHFVGQYVELARFDARLILEETRVEIGSNNLSVRADFVAQPARDRAATRTDLEAAPSLSDSHPRQRQRRSGVIAALDQLEPAALVAPRRIESILAHGLIVAPFTGPRQQRSSALIRRTQRASMCHPSIGVGRVPANVNDFPRDL
jgi:hypothetical protein